MNTIKKMLVTLAICTMLSFISAAQNSEPAQLNHEKRVYVDENGDYFIQKSLPLYLKFSITPDGKNYTLKSKKTPKYANPVYLDSEGLNTIRTPWAVDPNTMKTVMPMIEVVYEIYADGLPPYTRIRLHDAPRYVSQGRVFYGKGLNISLTSRDAVSGVENIHYALNSSSFTNYSNTIAVPDEKDYDLYYYTSDKVGNAEKTRSSKFTVDITSPKTTHEIVGIVHNQNIISPRTKFSLSSTDNLSGVRTTYYSYDNGKRIVYPGYKVSAAYLSDGDHVLNYYSVDHVKNEETSNSFSFYLDKIPPVVTTTIEGDQYIGKYKYVSPRTDINMAATDNKAGVKSISYLIDWKGEQTFTSKFKAPDKKGTHAITYYGADNVENKSAKKTLSVYMDNIPPTTGIKYGAPKFFAMDTLFINKTTNISLYAKDYESGVQKIEYAVDGGGFKEYAKFTIQDEGLHKITFKSTDRVNNVEQVKDSEVFVDNTPPEIYHHFSIQPVGNISKKGKQLDLYPNYTRLYLAATDKITGTAQIKYSLNGGKTFKDYSSPYTLDVSELNLFKKKKYYEVLVVAKDKLGNKNEVVIEFFVGR